MPPVPLRVLPLVLALAVAAAAPGGRAQAPWPDTGAAGAWQKLLKLRTIASVMHTTAHPDDEHGGLLAMLSRGYGARVTLLTLTRGEAGDNAIGPELFDELGLIRTRELLLADRYYGVDQQYFGTVADYGFSKRLDEAIAKWGRDRVLGDLVAVIRLERPLVLVSRFQGNARDGHGNHAAAGLLTREAFGLAGDPKAFPEQIAQGLRPWQPLKLYIGGVRAAEDWTVGIDTGEYDPVLGDSYHSLARRGLSFQRSQNSGRFNPQPGPAPAYYTRLESLVEAPAKEKTFFDGIDTSVTALYEALRAEGPAAARPLLEAIDRETRAAMDEFEMTDPSAAAPALARALAAARKASAALGGNPDVQHVLAAKEGQIQDAIHAVLGLTLTAIAQPAGTSEQTGPFSAGPAPMGPVVPGQTFQVRAAFANRSPARLTGATLTLESAGDWQVRPGHPPEGNAGSRPLTQTFDLTVPVDAPLTRPHFTRRSIQDAIYTTGGGASPYQPWPDPPLHVVARFGVDGVPVTLRRPIVQHEPRPPYGHIVQPVAIVPALSVTLSPMRTVLPISRAGRAAAGHRRLALTVNVLHNREGAADADLTLRLPAGWTAEPAARTLRFSRAGERAVQRFDVAPAALDGRDHRIEAVVSSGGREYREGYTALRHRDLETTYAYREASATVRGVDVAIAPGLTVGYVMGVGDDVPQGLAQLGVTVHPLGEQELASAGLGRFDAIVTGTRAYAVRQDLRTYNGRLLDYVREGGNLIVLYNTQELEPARFAPYPGELPGTAEEVSEEDSPVEILAPAAAVLNRPNRIARADFDGWVEQRGSKFWTSWDPRYVPIIATRDTGQAPQAGGWLHARYGKGHYTYFAYALHRQLPYGVPGAYRLLANLLSLGRGRE